MARVWVRMKSFNYYLELNEITLLKCNLNHFTIFLSNFKGGEGQYLPRPNVINLFASVIY
jgi:hypothetical protein